MKLNFGFPLKLPEQSMFHVILVGDFTSFSHPGVGHQTVEQNPTWKMGLPGRMDMWLITIVIVFLSPLRNLVVYPPKDPVGIP